MPIALDSCAVFRICAWPIESLDRFVATDLAAEARQLDENESELQRRSELLSQQLHFLVPRLGHRASRHWVLDVKRALHKTATLWRPATCEVRDLMAATSPQVWASICLEEQQRLELRLQVSCFETRWQNVTNRQREALEEIADDPSFVRALLVASPRLADQWMRRKVGSAAVDRKRRRQLNSVVLRYLLRAVGRPTPQAAWAGVATVRDIEGDHLLTVRQTSGRTAIAPDLRPFREAVAQLSIQARYVRDYPLIRDPATHREGGYWHGLDRAGRWRRLPCNVVFDSLIEAFVETGPRRLEPLLDALCRLSDTPHDTRRLLDRAVDLLVEIGLLRSALEFPAASSSPWQALRAVGRQLRHDDAAVWNRSIDQCSRIAERLVEDFDRLNPPNLQAHIKSFEAVVLSMLNALKIHAPLPEQLLRLDRTAPFDIGWSLAGRDELLRAIVAVLDVHAQAGAAEAWRRGLLGNLADGLRPLSEVVRCVQHDTHGTFAKAIDLWRTWWAHSSLTVKDDTALVAASSGLPSVPGFRGTMSFWVLSQSPPLFRWARPQPDIAVNRFPVSVQPVALQPRPPLAVAEVVGIDPDNPNAAIRRNNPPTQVGRHQQAVAPLSDLLLKIDTERRAWILSADQSKQYVPTYSSAARIGRHDPVSGFLFQLAMTHGWEFVTCAAPPIDCRGVGEGLRVEVDGRVALSQRRWLITASEVSAMLPLSAPTRYRHWCRLVAARRLPHLAWIGRAAPPDYPALIARTDSPLIVECILNYLGAIDMIVTEVPAVDSWPVRDRDGRHYAAELCVGWNHADYPDSTY
jgi:hypothetical protein